VKKRNPIVDELREEYIQILPEMRLAAQELETRIKSALLPLTKTLKSPARFEVKVRIKDCESAIKKLRKNHEEIFDPEMSYSLLELDDLVGARVLTFMDNTMVKANKYLKAEFQGWKADHKKMNHDKKRRKSRKRKEKPLWLKYKGKCNRNDRIKAEYQICPMLIGLFGDVEHSAIYKPAAALRGIETVEEIKDSKEEVYKVLRNFEKLVEEVYMKFKREK